MKAQEILQQVSNDLGVSVESIISESRKSNLVAARSIVCRKMRQEGFSLEEIGETINRHHASVVHSLKTYKGDGTKKPKIKRRKIQEGSHVEEIIRVFDEEITRLQEAKQVFIQIMNR